MLHLAWQDKFSVGVAELDSQHKHLLVLLNKLLSMSHKPIVKEEFFGMLNQFVKYAETHFVTEERLMEEHGFPGLKEHAAIHAAFVIKMFALTEGIQNSDINAARELVEYVKNWYVEHVLGTDREYIALLAEKGVR